MISSDTNFEAHFSMETEATPIPEDLPFHILFLGDYSGRQNLSLNSKLPNQNFESIEIDRDNFDDVLNSLNVLLRLNLQTHGTDYLEIKFHELEDFHPDRIFNQISVFTDLKKLRNELLHPESFEYAAKDVRRWLTDEINSINDGSDDQHVNDSTSGNLLDDILTENKADASDYKVTSLPELDVLIRDLVKPHLIKTDESEQAKLVSVVDAAISELMREILHHKDFKALESAWKALYFTVRRIETNNSLKLFLMDISQSELSDNLKSAKDLQQTDFFKQCIDKEIPYSLIAGNYDFELNIDDAATLIRVAKICETNNSPFISQIKPQMIGIESLSSKPNNSDWVISDKSNESKLWNMLRSIPESKYLGMCLPKFLTRLPYGEETEPTEVFSFEEFTNTITHENYLWSNSSYLWALLFAKSYSKFSWDFSNRIITKIEGLSTHIFNVDGDMEIQSPVEIYMTHKACEELLNIGLNPVISYKNEDTTKFVGFRSVSKPSNLIAGRWKY